MIIGVSGEPSTDRLEASRWLSNNADPWVGIDSSDFVALV
jgi:hypothetical protein